MKTVLAFIVFFGTIVSTQTQAQQLGLGLKTGFNISTLTESDESNGPMFGSLFSAHAHYMFTEHVGIQAGFMFTQAGTTFEWDGGNSQLTTNYMALPVSARFKWGMFTLNTGFQPAVLLKATQDSPFDFGDEKIDVTDVYNNVDVGVFVAPGIEFPIGITMSISPILGLMDVFDGKASEPQRNFVMQFTVGYNFNFNK